MKQNILVYFQETVKKYSDKTAIVDSENQFTFHQLQLTAKMIGGTIKLQYPFTKRPVVVIMEKRGMEIATFLGVLYSGNYYVPIDPNIPTERLRGIIEELDNPLVIVDSLFACDELFEMSEYVWKFDLDVSDILAEKQYEEMDDCGIMDVDPLYIIYTSGSTGHPKGVVIPHRAVIDCMEEMAEAMEMCEKNSLLNVANFYFDASVPDIYNTIFNGCTLHIVDKRTEMNPLKMLKYISENRINTLIWVPSNLIFIANTPFLSKVDVSCLENIFFCGEVLPIKYLNIWRKKVPMAKYVNYYGPTEATYACTYYVVEREFENDELLPIGHPCKNTRLLILDEDKNEVEKGEIGELYVQGTCLALGYFKNVLKTQECFIQNPFHQSYDDKYYRTGDLVKVGIDGNLEYVGRKDFQIKYHGYRIELGDIENAICNIDGIRRACCVFDEEREQIIGVYESNEIIQDLDDKLLKLLPEYMIPQRLVRSENIPLNSNGKIDRRQVLCDSLL